MCHDIYKVRDVGIDESCLFPVTSAAAEMLD